MIIRVIILAILWPRVSHFTWEQVVQELARCALFSLVILYMHMQLDFSSNHTFVLSIIIIIISLLAIGSFVWHLEKLKMFKLTGFSMANNILKGRCSVFTFVRKPLMPLVCLSFLMLVIRGPGLIIQSHFVVSLATKWDSMQRFTCLV